MVDERPICEKYFTIEDLEKLLVKVRTKAEFIAVTSNIEIYRYLKANFMLALANDD